MDFFHFFNSSSRGIPIGIVQGHDFLPCCFTILYSIFENYVLIDVPLAYTFGRYIIKLSAVDKRKYENTRAGPGMARAELSKTIWTTPLSLGNPLSHDQSVQ